MSDQAKKWLYDHKETALAAKDWGDFCERTGHMGAFYRKYAWLAKHFETLRARPDTFLYQPLALPNARKASDLFTSAYLCPHIVRGKGQGSYTDAPPNTVFVGGRTRDTFAVSRSMGGRRRVETDKYGMTHRTHYGSTFFVTYAALTPDVRAWYDAYNAKYFDLSSIEAIDREDGVLIVAKHAQISGGPWLALLDKGETLESMFDDETRKRLAEDREAERVAFEA